MGTQMYSLTPLKNFEMTDGKLVHYYWIDKNIETKENKLYVTTFEKYFSIQVFSEINSLKQQLTRVNQNNQIVRVICSASLSQDNYQTIQRAHKIDRALLFCQNRTRASILIRDYPKIKLACFGYAEVIRMVQQWAREQAETIYFFQEEDVSRLTLASNWHYYPQVQQTFSYEASQYFINYCLSEMTEEISNLGSLKTEIKEAERKKESPQWLISTMFKNKQVLKKINNLLKYTKDASKLGYILWPVHQMYTYIKERYRQSKLKSQPSYSGLIFLNEDEKKRLKLGQYVSINQFIRASSGQIESSKTKSGEIEINIQIPKFRQKFCNGYYEKQKEAIFNIGNFYKILSFDWSMNSLYVELVSLSEKTPINIGDPLSGIIINQLRTERCEFTQQGQWYNLFVNGKQNEARQYIQRLQAKSKKQNHVRWAVTREKIKLKLGRSLITSLKQLENLSKSIVQRDQDKFIIYYTIAELNLVYRGDNNFIDAYSKLESDVNSIKLQDMPVQFIKKVELLQIAHRLICSKEQAKVGQRLNELQKELVKDLFSSNNLDIYLLCLLIKSIFYQKAKDYRAQIETINKILWFVASTEGRQSHMFQMMNTKKRDAIEKMNDQQHKMQLKKKQDLRTTQISISQLLQRDTILRIDISGLNMSLYD